MTLAGYITDRRCPSNPEHGVCHDQERGLFCPHSDHHARGTQFFWSYDEFQAAKSLPSATAAPTGNLKIKVEKPKRRATQKARRKR